MQKPDIETIKRVVIEHAELWEKGARLTQFLDNNSAKISEQDYHLLCEQLDAMVKYKAALVNRLKFWGVM